MILKDIPGKRIVPGFDGEPGHRTRLSEVAIAAGVSAMTVSRVINGRTGVSAATRERVERAILAQELLHSLAERRPGQTGLVTVWVRSLDQPASIEMVRGIERRLQRSGLRVVLTSTSESENGARHAVHTLFDGSTDGAILIDPDPSMDLGLLRRQAIPFVVLDVEGNLDPDLPAVGISVWAGVRAATEHLLALGHRRIALLTCTRSTRSNDERVASFNAAFMAENLAPEPDFIRKASLETADGYDQVMDLLTLVDPPTAILCGSDDQAAGVYQALYESGLRPPLGMSVIGFGDQHFTSLLSPPLTTVHCPYREMGAVAGAMLLHLIAGEDLEGRRVEVAASLVARASCASPSPR